MHMALSIKIHPNHLRARQSIKMNDTRRSNQMCNSPKALDSKVDRHNKATQTTKDHYKNTTMRLKHSPLQRVILAT